MLVFRLPKSLWVLLCLAGLSLNILTLERWGYSAFSGQSDYLGSYTGGKLVGTAKLYDRNAQFHLRESLGFPNPNNFYWIRFPVYALLFKPFTWTSYETGLMLWKLFSLVLVILAIQLSPGPRWLSVLAYCLSLPLWATFVLGNDGAVILLAVALFARFVATSQERAAGLVFGAITVLKPQIAPLVWIVLFVYRKWHLIGWAMVSGSALLLACFLIQGWNWPVVWMAFVHTGITPDAWAMPNITGMLLHAEPMPWVAAAAIACVIWILWYRREKPGVPMAPVCAAAMLAAIAISPHSYLYDYALPIPLLMLATIEDPAFTKWAALFLLPLIYLPLALGLAVIGPALVVFSVAAMFLFFPHQRATSVAESHPLESSAGQA